MATYGATQVVRLTLTECLSTAILRQYADWILELPVDVAIVQYGPLRLAERTGELTVACADGAALFAALADDPFLSERVQVSPLYDLRAEPTKEKAE